MRSKAKWALRLSVPVALAVAGCNTILGINPAQDAVWDGSIPTGDDSTAGGDDGSSSVQPGSSSSGSSGGGTGDAQSFQSDAIAVWASWPMPNAADSGLPNPESYDASSLDFVYDTVTGLTWQRTLDTAVLGDGGTGTLSLPWSQAVAYCSNLSLDDGGWRMPARIELISLLNVTQDPAVDPATFPGTPAEEFWTASSLAPNPASAWYVDFGFSVQLVAYDDKTASHHVRCVR